MPAVIARKNIPNLLTILRLFLAGGLFVLLAFYRYDTGVAWLLIPAIVLFIAAAVTDALDGYLARKWEVVSKFGRIMDPFCDKVLVLGAVVFLAGPGFVDQRAGGTLVSGVYPWMVVLVISRELLVTGIRGEMESSGHDFGANVWGKLKMILQSIVVPTVLFIVLLLEVDERGFAWLVWVRDVLVYATVLVTLLSGLPYVTGAAQIIRAERGREADKD